MYFWWHLPIEHKIEEKKVELKGNAIRYKHQDRFEVVVDVKKWDLLAYLYWIDEVRLKKAKEWELVWFIAKNDIKKWTFITKDYNFKKPFSYNNKSYKIIDNN